jgi:hypothetical protein
MNKVGSGMSEMLWMLGMFGRRLFLLDEEPVGSVEGYVFRFILDYVSAVASSDGSRSIELRIFCMLINPAVFGSRYAVSYWRD